MRLSLVLMAALAGKAAAAPGWRTVPLGGGGFVPGLATDASGKKMYCRTDVGGAFRWIESKGEWVSVTDKIVPLGTPGASGLMGVGAITLDPSAPDRMYVAVGSYAYSNPRGVFMSEDSGATWKQIQQGGIVEANGPFRGLGNRLAVDPNDSKTLWFGTTEGLLKGSRGADGWTWEPVAAVPVGATPEKKPKAGVTFVACDTTEGKTITYAGVYDNVGKTGGIYVSTDGTTWAKVQGPDFPTPGRGRVAPDGTLYVTGGKLVGKIARGGELTLLKPLEENMAYGALAVDPSDKTGRTLYVAESSVAQFGKIFRTKDGGETWVKQFRNFNNNTHKRAEPDGTPTLTGYWFGSVGEILVNPANPEEVWATDFFGVYRTRNAGAFGTTEGCEWVNLQKGQEETVPHFSKNAPTGAKLITALADVSGFRYMDTSKRPVKAFGGSGIRNPDGGSSTSLDFSEADHNVWARGWINPYGWGGSGATSSDGGVSWVRFGQIADKTIESAPQAGWEKWDVTAFLKGKKAAGAKEVTFILCSANATSPMYSAESVKFDSKEAADASVRPKLVINGSTTVDVVADSYVSNGALEENFGAKGDLQVSYAYGNAPYSKWIYLKFDLAALPDVSTASLELNRIAGGTLKTSVGVYGAAPVAWEESTLHWKNKPANLAGEKDPVGEASMKIKGGRVAVSSKDPSRIVWLPESFAKPHYSTDRGVTWTECKDAPNSQMATQFNPGIGIQQLAADRVNGKFYVAYFGATHVIYASEDGGQTFKAVGSIKANTYNVYRAQLVAGLQAGHLWLADDGIDTPDGGGLWHSKDGGVTWTQIPGLTKVKHVSCGKGATSDSYSIFVDAKVKGGIIKVYRSDDYGSNWTALEEPPTVANIETMSADRQNHGRVFIGTGGRGIFEGE